MRPAALALPLLLAGCGAPFGFDSADADTLFASTGDLPCGEGGEACPSGEACGFVTDANFMVHQACVPAGTHH